MYGQTGTGSGIREWEIDGNPNTSPTLYKSWQSSALLTNLTPAANSDFAAVSNGGANIWVFFELFNSNSTSSLASIEYGSWGWRVGAFNVPAGRFKPGTRITSICWPSGDISVFYQDSNDFVYEKLFTSSTGWQAPVIFALADHNTDLTAYGAGANSGNRVASSLLG